MLFQKGQMIVILYKTTNQVNGKYYVGVHCQRDGFGPDDFDGYLGSGKLLLKAIKKYGRKSFIRTPIAVFFDPKTAYQMEEHIVNEEFVANQNTYNLKTGGEGGGRGVKRPASVVAASVAGHSGFRHSEETKKLLSEQRKNVKQDPEVVERRIAPQRGKPKHSEETRRMMSEMKMGVKWSPEQREKLCGRKQSEAQVKKRTMSLRRRAGSLWHRDWPAIQQDFENGVSYSDLKLKHDITDSQIKRARRHGLFVGKYKNTGFKQKP